MTLALMAKAFKLNYSTPTNNNQRISSNPLNRQIAQLDMNMGQDRQMQMVGGNGENQFRQYAGQNVWNLNRYNVIQNVRNQNLNGNGNMVAASVEGNTAGNNGNQIRCYNCRGVDGSAEVHDYENYDDNEIFNMFTQEEQCSELLEPISEQHQVPQNDNNVISEVTSVEQSGETVEQHPANFEETRALYDSLYHNLAIEVEKVNSVNRKLKETNADLTTELARFKNQEKCFEIKFSDDTTPSVARKFLNEVKSTIVTLQRIVKHIMTLETHNWSSSAHQELHKIVKDEIFPIVNQVDARVQNFKIQFLKEAAKFVGDFKSLAKKANESLAKHKILELEIERLLRAVVSQDIMSVVQKTSVVDTSNLQTELERTKERFENCIIKKENEYAKLWNDWYKKCEECKYDKISYNTAYKDVQQNIERLQAQLVDLKENAHLKATYKNLFDSISVSRTQTKTIIASLQNDLQNTIYKNAKLRTQLFKKVSDQKDNTRDTSVNTNFAKQSIVENLPKVGETHALSKPVTSNSVSTPQESKVMKNDKVISPGMFNINPFKTSKEEKNVPNTVRASTRTKPITVSQPHVFTKKDANSDSNGLSSTGIDNTKTRRP
nr:hypothetical protein [Tanacetum cinerariifolium]